MIFWSHNSDWAKARRATLPAHSAVSVHRVRRRCCSLLFAPPSPKRSALPKHRLRPLTHTCLVTLKGGLRGVLNHLLPACPSGTFQQGLAPRGVSRRFPAGGEARGTASSALSALERQQTAHALGPQLRSLRTRASSLQRAGPIFDRRWRGSRRLGSTD